MNNRFDAVAKVTGRAVYANDMSVPGMAYVSVVRSPYSHARILGIETEDARAVPGVLAVLTAADIPGVCSLPKERPVLCPDVVRFVGDGVALVAANTRSAAEEGARRVRVKYEELPPLLDPREALLPGSVQVHEGGNLICRYVTKRGDVQAALVNAPHVLEREYTTQRVQHVSLETEACFAQYNCATG